MGYLARNGAAARAAAAAACQGLHVAVDVQHVYREGRHASDRGTIYTVAGGRHVAEADCALNYAQAAIAALRGMGAEVLTNQPSVAILVGPYSRRNFAAMAWGADVYLACHANAGGGTYALAEVMEGSPGAPLARAIVDELRAAFPGAITKGVTMALAPGARGAVCIERFTRGPALILEPFFGDNRASWPLMTLEGLASVGGAVARGVATWWALKAKAPA